MSDVLSRRGAALADRYRIAHELSEGPMTTVYLARDLKHDRDVGTPSVLLRRKDLGRLSGGGSFGYDVHPDGSRVVLVVPIDRPDALPTTVVLNWLDELKAKVKR